MGNATGNPQAGAAALLEQIKTVDGAGSGLDADTLDGLHESSIFRCRKYGFLDMLSDDYDEWSKIPSGMYSFAKSHIPGSECPIPWGFLLHFVYAFSEGQVINIAQFVADMFSGTVYLRAGDNGRWVKNWTQFGGVILRLLDLASERRRTA